VPSVSADEVRQLAQKIKAIAVTATDRKNVEESLASRVDALVAGAQSELPLTPAGDLDDAQWMMLAVNDRQQRQTQLLRYYDALAVLVASDGPTDPGSIMFRDYVSNRGILGLTLFALLGTLLLLFTIHSYWPQATEAPSSRRAARAGGEASGTVAAPVTAPGAETILPGPLEQDVLLMVMMMGALGGFIHMTSSVTKYIGNRQFVRSWVVYYLLMPVEGSGLAVTLYLVVRVGVLNPASSNGNVTQSLNWVGMYALSILAGLFSKQALELLGNVFNTLFQRVIAKDAGGTGRPSDDKSPGPK
jgi:hypothetical protein